MFFSPPSEPASRGTLVAAHNTANSLSSQSLFIQTSTPLENTSSDIISYTPPEPSSPRSPGGLTLSIVGSTPTPVVSQQMRRSDTWWGRFARTNFLDRKTSNASRRPPVMLDIRDPNPPPTSLTTIEESALSSPNRDTLGPASEFTGSAQSLSERAAAVYGSHNKSTTSLRTADSEAIERMAGRVDVVQRVRTTTGGSTGSMGSLMGDNTPEEKITDTAELVSSPLDMESTEPFVRDIQHLSPVASATSVASSHSQQRLVGIGGGAVASRIREYERQMSQDQEVPSPTNTRQREERSGKSITVNYGLVQRPSLFVANPDHRTSSVDS